MLTSESTFEVDSLDISSPTNKQLTGRDYQKNKETNTAGSKGLSELIYHVKLEPRSIEIQVSWNCCKLLSDFMKWGWQILCDFKVAVFNGESQQLVGYEVEFGVQLYQDIAMITCLQMALGTASAKMSDRPMWPKKCVDIYRKGLLAPTFKGEGLDGM